MAKTAFHWDDPFLLDQQLTEDERMIREAAAAYCQDKLLPRVTEAFRHEKTDTAIFREMGELGLIGPTIPTEYGGPGLSYVAYGLIAREVERAVVLGDAADFRIRHRSAAPKIPAQIGHGRMDWLLWLDRTRPRLGPGQHGQPRP